MRYPFLKFNVHTRLFRKSLSVVASCNQLHGFLLTAYWTNKPLLDLMDDWGAGHPSPVRHDHEWVFLRWSVNIPARDYPLPSKEELRDNILKDEVYRYIQRCVREVEHKIKEKMR